MLKDHDSSLTSAIHLPCLHICFKTISLIKDTVWEKVAVESKTIKAEYFDTDWYADRPITHLIPPPRPATIALIDTSNGTLRLAKSDISRKIATVAHRYEEGLTFDVFSIEGDIAWCREAESTRRFELMSITDLRIHSDVVYYHNNRPHIERHRLQLGPRPNQKSATAGIAQKQPASKRAHTDKEDAPVKKPKILHNEPVPSSLRRSRRDRPVKASSLLVGEMEELQTDGKEEQTANESHVCKCCGIGESNEELMVRCDGQECKGINWFHLDCVSRKSRPKEFCCRDCSDSTPGGEVQKRKD